MIANASPKYQALVVAGLAGYVEYSDLTLLFHSVSNRNRVIKELKEDGLISIVANDGLRCMNLTKKGRDHVAEKYPGIKLFTSYSGSVVRRHRRCVVAKLLINMALWKIPISLTDIEGMYFFPGKVETMDLVMRQGRMSGILSTPHMDFHAYQLGQKGLRWNDTAELNQMNATRMVRGKDVGMIVFAEGYQAFTDILKTSADNPMRIRNQNNAWIHLPDYFPKIYFIGCEDAETAKLELLTIADKEATAIFDEVFGGSNCLIPMDGRKLYRLTHIAEKQTVFVQEAYAGYLKELMPQHEVIGVPTDGVRQVLYGEEE